MAQRLTQYDPKAILMSLGAIPIDGFGDGTFVKITSDEAAFSLKVGADGEATRVRTNNNAATIEVTLMQGSLSNTLLSNLHQLDRSVPGGLGVAPFLLKDLLSAAQYVAEQAWVEKPPDAEFALEAGTRTWMIRTHNLVRVDGGA
jgi:hypothetical protein